MERRKVLAGVASVVGVGLGVTGSASASKARSSSSVVVGVHDDDLSATKEVYYDTNAIPQSHLDGYARQNLDVIAVTDTSDLDCDWMMTLHLCPRSKNGQRINNEWGADKQVKNGILEKEEGHRLLGVHDKPQSIELTEVGIRVSYAEP